MVDNVFLRESIATKLPIMSFVTEQVNVKF